MLRSIGEKGKNLLSDLITQNTNKSPQSEGQWVQGRTTSSQKAS